MLVDEPALSSSLNAVESSGRGASREHYGTGVTVSARAAARGRERSAQTYKKGSVGLMVHDVFLNFLIPGELESGERLGTSLTWFRLEITRIIYRTPNSRDLCTAVTRTATRTPLAHAYLWYPHDLG